MRSKFNKTIAKGLLENNRIYFLLGLGGHLDLPFHAVAHLYGDTGDGGTAFQYGYGAYCKLLFLWIYVVADSIRVLS